jgi:hypothetical protein
MIPDAVQPSLEIAPCCDLIATTQLYHLDTGDRIYLPTRALDGSKYCELDFLDGMYSHCTTEAGGVLYLSRFAPLLVTDHGYELIMVVK